MPELSAWPRDIGATVDSSTVSNPASRILANTVDDLLRDTGLAERAAEAGRQHREWLGSTSVLATFEGKSRELLGF